MKNDVSVFVLTVCCCILISCSYPSKPFTEKRIIIASNETIKIPELNLSISNTGCGRKWIAEGDKPAFERTYCGLVAKQKDSTVTGGGDFKPIYVGNVEITIEKMNPWGREEDSVPPGGCRVLVRKVEGR